MKPVGGGHRVFHVSVAPRSWVACYAFALGLAGLATVLRAGLERVAPAASHAYFVVLLPVVVLTGVFCGTGPAVVAAFAGGIAASTLFYGPGLLAWPPLNGQQFDAALLALACASVLMATHALRRALLDAGAAEARLAEVFRQIPAAAAIIAAPDGALLLRSAQSLQVLGHDPRALPTSDGMARYQGEHEDGTPFAAGDYPIVRALRQGAEVRGEMLRYRHPDGRLAYLDVTAGPVRGPGGEIVAAVGMAFDATPRVEREQALREALAAREMLLREADHRIKNSLQLVVSLLSLQRGRLEDRDAAAAIDSAIARVNAVADSHLALQRSPDLRTVELQPMLSGLCERLATLNPAVSLICEAPPAVFLDAEKAIPLGMILSELLTNALRHAYPAGVAGTVRVRAEMRGTRLDLLVADDGSGMAAQPPSAKRRSLGTTIVQSFSARIGARIATRSAPGEGTAISLLMEMPPAA